METITLTHKELDQLRVLKDLEQRKISQLEAAKLLDLSTRQVRRKSQALASSGPASLVHGSRDRPGNHQLGAVKEQAVALVKAHYRDFGPTLASEKLLECHGVTIHPETLRLAMGGAGLWQPHHRRRTPAPHVWRERKESMGELVQGDGSPHAWFEERAPKCTLLAFIDDATSQILWLELATNESTDSLMTSTWHYLEAAGRPLALYFDRGGVYKVNLGNPENDKLTQYQRAVRELGIRLIHARSPQAKGRVERLFGTLQDRLVKELRLAGISAIPEANRFIQETYLPQHNARFAVAPRSTTDLHRSLEGYDLQQVLCLKTPRRLTSDLTIQYHGQWLQLETKQATIVQPKDTVVVYEQLSGDLSLWIRQTQLSFHSIIKAPPSQLPQPAQLRASLPPHRPRADHPWRQYPNRAQKPDISNLEKPDILTLV